jgi:hypothetical protein
VSGEVLNIQPVPVEVQRLQELLFEHSGALPEGAYLEAMDCLKAMAYRSATAPGK